jgi:hypothetical protein
MNSQHPPVLATWVLKSLGCGPNNECLIGDLVEQYRRGRSGGWYWRQVLIAVVMSFGKEIRSHYVLAVRAIAIGWSVAHLLGYVLRNLLGNEWMILLSKLAPIGWGRQLLALIPGWVAWAGIGWIVGRLHRPYQTTMVLLYVLSNSVFMFPFFSRELYRLALDSLDDSRFLPYLVFHVVSSVAILVSILVGGFLSAPHRTELPAKQGHVAA